MKLYNYLAFSIYQIFNKTIKRDRHFTLLIKTSFVLTLMMLIIFYSILCYLDLKGYHHNLIPKVYLFLIMFLIWLPNYFYLRKEKFLNSDFLFSYKNILSFLVVIFGLGSVFMFVANKNRERIFKERGYSREVINNGGAEPFDPAKKPESFEGELRLWYYNNFEK